MKMELVFAMVAAVGLASCSSDGDIVPKKDRFARPGFDAGKPPRDPNANCVKPGTPNNELGIGGYCETSADCPTDQGPRFCSADFKDLGQIEDDKWFCTTLCNSDADCGTGVRCTTGLSGTGCSPIVCAADAGTSSVQDAGRYSPLAVMSGRSSAEMSPGAAR